MRDYSRSERALQSRDTDAPKCIAEALQQSTDKLGCNSGLVDVKLERLSNLIRLSVQDPDLAEAVVRRVSLAAIDGLISRPRLERRLDYIARRRREGTLRNPGGYFVTCAMEMFQQAGLPWSVD